VAYLQKVLCPNCRDSIAPRCVMEVEAKRLVVYGSEAVGQISCFQVCLLGRAGEHFPPKTVRRRVTVRAHCSPKHFEIFC